MRPLVQPFLNELVPYIPGKPIQETEREFGVSNLAKLASNENCLGPSPKAAEALANSINESHLYPDAGCYYLKQALLQRHEKHGIKNENLVLANGTNEIISMLVRVFVGPEEALLNAWPSFVCYRLAARATGIEEASIPLTDDYAYDLEKMAAYAQSPEGRPIKMVFVGNPNNPTGRYIPKPQLDAFMEAIPQDVIVIIDEAYAEYANEPDYPDAMEWIAKRPRTVVTRTFSKAFGLAAARVGYAVCDSDIADILNRFRDPFNVNSWGQTAALASLSDEAHVIRSRIHNSEQLPIVSKELERLGMKITPSIANFVLAEIPEGNLSLDGFFREMIGEGIIVRPVANYGFERGVRISIGTQEENARLFDAVKTVLERN
jgi:histidinol-phosphate aminotransferase